MRSIVYCCKFNLSQWRKNSRVICVFLLLLGYVYSIIEPISQFSTDIEYKCTPWLFPFITSDANCILILMTLYVILLCDAPFLFKYQKYLIIRTGKTKWILGQLMYVAVATFIYWFSISIFSIILLFSNLTFSNEWGKIISTLSQTRMGARYQLFFLLDYKIIIYFSPIKAFTIAFILAWVVSFFIGLIILYFNLSKQKYLGIIIATILIFSQHFAHMASGYWFYKISPVSWISLCIINFSNQHTNMPSITFVISCLAILIILFIYLIIKKVKLKSIDIIQ